MTKGISLTVAQVIYNVNLDQELEDEDIFYNTLDKIPGIVNETLETITVDQDITWDRLTEVIDGAFHLSGGWAKDNKDAAQPEPYSAGFKEEAGYVSGFLED